MSLAARLRSLISLRAVVTLVASYVFMRVIASTLSNLRALNVDISIEPELFSLVAMMGLGVGWGLAASRLRGGYAFFLVIVGGLVVITLRVGQLGEDVFTLLVGSISYVIVLVMRLWETAVTEVPLILPNLFPIVTAAQRLGNALPVLGLRALQWFFYLVISRPNFDPVGAALIWSFIGWSLASWLTWFLRRRDAVLTALFPFVILAGTLSYYFDPNRNNTSFLLSAVLSAVLFLTAFNSHEVRQRFWNQNHIDYFDEVWRDLAVYAIPISLGLIILVNVMPNNIVSEIVDQFNKMIRYRVESSAPPSETDAGLRPGTGAGSGEVPPPAPPSIFEQVRSPGLPRHHLITARTEELSKELVMYASTNELQPNNAVQPRYYWRHITYDIYTGRGWLASAPYETDYLASQPVEDANRLPARHAVRQNILLATDLKGLLLQAGTLITVDQNFRVAWREPGDFYAAKVEATEYRVVSMISHATQDQLRRAGENYPPAIRNRYLQLPDDLPPRVRALARNLTATAPSPYDRAKIIEQYLRQFPYTLDLYDPPIRRDVVDYFLFDLQRGYCDYYATSMVVLVRAAGVPARLVTGYASGKYDAQQNRFTVTEAEGHSWVEVYFPNYGWIEFEPTGGRAEIVQGSEAVPPSGLNAAQLIAEFRFNPLVDWWKYLLGVLGLGLTFFAAWLALDALRLWRLAPLPAAEVLYARVRGQVKRFKVPLHTGDTPYEFQKRIEGLQIEALPLIIEAYARANYQPAPFTAQDRNHLIRLWQRARWQLWWRYWQQRFAKFARRF